MTQLLLLLATRLPFLVEPDRYGIVGSTSSAAFGGNGSITLECGATRLQLIRERGELALRFQATSGDADEWFWLGIARRVLLGDRPGSDALDDAAIDFLASRLPEIESMFSGQDSREELLRQLRAAREDRARELFG